MNLILRFRNQLVHREILSRINRVMLKPSMVHVSITDRCNLRCRVCDIWKTQIKKELSTKEWISIIKQLRAWL
nr:hypothetical protein [Nanoarchaeota archaeon]